MRRDVISWPVAVLLCTCCQHVFASVYRVGPGEKLSTVSAVAGMLLPGDVVEITGDVTDAFTLTRHGTPDKPVSIRGITRLEDGVIVRPKVTLPADARSGIICRADWCVIEGLDIGGMLGPEWAKGTPIILECDSFTLRNCRIHHCLQGLLGNTTSGSVLIEFCEFDSLGGTAPSGGMMHGVYLCSSRPGAVATVQYCYFHDSVFGALLKSRCPRNVIRYNWFENQYFAAVSIIDVLGESYSPDADLPPDPLYPMHTDIVGNVFVQGSSPGPRYSILSLGGEHTVTPGTEGDFSIAHNLFVTSRGAVSPDRKAHVVAALVSGNVDHVNLYNNVLLSQSGSALLYERGTVWDTPQTRRFVARRGDGEPLLQGSNNWVSSDVTSIPATLVNTLRGPHPAFTDLLTGDYRPRPDSPLATAGLWPLPKGQIVSLVPEYEPQRGIPPTLKPRPRRKADRPTIGPFEVAE